MKKRKRQQQVIVIPPPDNKSAYPFLKEKRTTMRLTSAEFALAIEHRLADLYCAPPIPLYFEEQYLPVSHIYRYYLHASRRCLFTQDIALRTGGGVGTTRFLAYALAMDIIDCLSRTDGQEDKEGGFSAEFYLTSTNVLHTADAIILTQIKAIVNEHTTMIARAIQTPEVVTITVSKPEMSMTTSGIRGNARSDCCGDWRVEWEESGEKVCRKATVIISSADAISAFVNRKDAAPTRYIYANYPDLLSVKFWDRIEFALGEENRETNFLCYIPQAALELHHTEHFRRFILSKKVACSVLTRFKSPEECVPAKMVTSRRLI